jgi:putative PIG3 family NAD(P)H quinone oxidoreductase
VRAVVFAGAGGNEVIRLEERPDPVPGSEELLLQVTHAGLNPADLAQRAGSYPAPPGSPQDIPGLEVAGTVAACGAQVLGWKPGDRVFGLVGGGGLADRVIVHQRCVAAVPDVLDDAGAAAVPEAFITAHDAIRSQAALSPGETLLVHGAAGGVGSAALQIAIAGGSRVLGTVRSANAGALVRELGGEPIDDEGFAEAVLSATGGQGANVILELVGAPHFPDNLRAIAMLGRVVIVGLGAGAEVSLVLRQLMSRRASIRGTMLRARPLEEKALAVRAFEREVLPHLAGGRIKPVIDSVIPYERTGDAFDRLAGSGKRGKVLLHFA